MTIRATRMSRIFQGIVHAGFVVGANRPSDTELTTNTAAGAGNDAQALYLEVREGQTLVDPASWFALEQQMDVK